MKKLVAAVAGILWVAASASAQQYVKDNFQTGPAYQLPVSAMVPEGEETHVLNPETQELERVAWDVLMPYDYAENWPGVDPHDHKPDMAWKAESGGVQVGNVFWMPWAGGHADYGGVEIHKFDFETGEPTRVEDAVPLIGPPMHPDGVDCPGADGWPDRPSAGHLYNGSNYWPATADAPEGELLSTTANGFCTGRVSKQPQAHIYNIATGDYRPWQGMEPFPKLSKSRSAWVRGRLYYMNNSGKLYRIERTSTGEYPAIDLNFDVGAVNPDGMMAWNPVGEELCWTRRKNKGKGGFYCLPVDEQHQLGTVRTVLDYDEADPYWNVGTFAFGSDGIARFTDGYSIWFTVDPQAAEPSRTFLDGSAVPAPRKASSAGKQFSRIVLFEWTEPTGEHRLWWGSIIDPENGWWGIGEQLSGGSGPIGELLSFEERCEFADVLCDPLDTEAPTWVDLDGQRHEFLNPDGSSGIPTELRWWRKPRGIAQKHEEAGFAPPQLDRRVKRSGTGSLRFELPGLSGQNFAGTYTTELSEDGSRAFGPGDSLFMQVAVRMNCETMFVDCDPASDTYMQERWCYHKDVEDPDACTWPKLWILSTQDWRFHPDSPKGQRLYDSSNACTWHELVFNFVNWVPKGYNSCRWYKGWAEIIGKVRGSQQIDYQNQLNCWRYPEPELAKKREMDVNYVGPNCWVMPADQWVYFQIGYEFGEYQPDKVGPPQTRVRVWAGLPGETATLLHDNMIYMDHTGDVRRVGKIWLLPYVTNKDAAQDHELGLYHYDEMLFATKRIPDPAE